MVCQYPGYAGTMLLYFNDYFIVGKMESIFKMLYNGNEYLDNIDPGKVKVLGSE